MPCGSSKDTCNQDKNAANGRCAFEDLDHSILQQPLNLGVTNIRQILKCVQSGSREIKDIILNECNIVYECKACVGLFRSLANFMYHKRCYCKKHMCEGMLLFENFDEEETITVQPEAPKAKPVDTAEEFSKMSDSVMDIEKSDVAQETVSDASKEKNPVSNKGKTKEPPESKNPENSMISRRTRDKNAQNPIPNSSANRVSTKMSTPKEPPLKCAKIASEITESDKLDSCKESSENETGKSDKMTTKQAIDKSSSDDNVGKQQTVLNKEIKTKKIEFSKISGMLEKNMPFPKIIFKTIDSNQNAVYQSDDKKKIETFGLGKKFETATVETKVDNDKLIIVLKKDVKSDSSSDSKVSEATKQKSDSDKPLDFHLTRRKRLMARTDCSVHDLKCLVCKTQFMSLKTLYFHMLSLHSKKRLYYPCPFCKTFFVQMYGVTRHLISIHNKSKDQINRLRELIKKKSVWKKVDDANPALDKNISPLNYQIKEASPPPPPPPEIKTPEAPKETETGDPETLRTVIKLSKNVTLHQCTKCNRVFGRKSSQVSHEKFCIMNNPIKIEGADSPPIVQPPTTPASSNQPVVSFLSLAPKTLATPKPTNVTPMKPENSYIKSTSFVEKQVLERMQNTKISIRPKRGAEKQMHKDFVNSQTLKWRSANRIDTNVNTIKAPSAPKKPQKDGKNLEKKVLSIMNSEDLTCIKCDKKFSSYSNLRRHVAIHVGWTRFKCKFCDYQAYNKSQCWAHVQKAHAVDENEMEKSIVHLVNSNTSNKKSQLKEVHASTSKHKTGASVKISHKTNTIPKVKISKKKIVSNSKNSGKKSLHAQKKDTSEIKKEKDKDSDIEIIESKKEKPQTAIPVQKIPKKDASETKKEKSHTSVFQKFSKKDAENKKEKSHVIPIQKLTIPRETNYKSVTTSNPTTIILSKKIPTSTVQPIVTIPPESASSSSKISPIRTSPRKTEVKEPGRLITTLVTRSNAYTKANPIQIKLPTKPNSVDELSKVTPEKNCLKKERLISEWFPKKDLSPSNVRRESAPLIIGLVPAGLKERIKSPADTPEKNSTSPSF